MRPDPVRRGHSLVELIVALLLLTTLAAACVALLSVQLRLVRELADLAEAGNAVRFTGRLLRSEAWTLVPADDIDGIGPDSLRQRVFRGIGIVCGGNGSAVEVRYRGLRDPDPAKDSLLILAGNGESVRPIAAVSTPSTPACTARAGETVLELDTGAPPAAGLVLVFERGTWHLSAAALRYARGAGGRQPVTASVLIDDSTDLALVSAGGEPVSIALRIAAGLAGNARAGLLREIRRIALLNLSMPLDSSVLAP